MKRKKTWKKIVAIFMAVTMLPFGSLENCFASVAYGKLSTMSTIKKKEPPFYWRFPYI